jgi:hypothetical protein
MATEVHVMIAWGMVLVSAWVVAAILIFIGLLMKKTEWRSAGFVLLGLAAFMTPFAFYLNKFGTSDMVLTVVIAFLGGAFTAIGVLTYGRPSRKRP